MIKFPLFCLLLVVILFVFGCSTMHIVKECHPVEGLDEIYVCKNMKPWE